MLINLQRFSIKMSTNKKGWCRTTYLSMKLKSNLLVNEAEEQVLKFRRVVRPVDDVAIVLQIELGLSTELASEVLGRV